MWRIGDYLQTSRLVTVQVDLVKEKKTKGLLMTKELLIAIDVWHMAG